MALVGGAVVWAIAGAGSAVVGQTGEASDGDGAGAEIETAYIPEAANFAVVARPAQILEQPGFTDDPLFEQVLAEVSEGIGFDVAGIEQVTVIGVLGEDDPPRFYGAIVRTIDALPQEEIIAHWSAPLPGLLGDLARGPLPLGVASPEERTLLIAPEGNLREMLAADGADSLLTDALARADGSRQVVVVIDWTPVADELARELSQAPEARVRAVAPVFADALTWTIEGDLAPRVEAALTFDCDEEEAAARVVQAAEGAMELAGDQLDQIRGFLGQFPPREQAMARTFLMFADGALVAAEVEQQGSRVVASTRVEQSGALLISALLPAVEQARTSAQRSVCRNNLRQLMLAMHNYHDVHGKFPAAASYDAEGRPLLSWRVELLPYLDQQALYDEFHLDEPWDSPHNRELINRMPEVFACPEADAPPGTTTYLAPIHADTVFPDGTASSIRDITDGTSNTICFVEADAGQAVVWTQPDDWEFDPVAPTAGLLGTHEGGFHVAMCDGSVRFISENIDKDVLRALFTRRGGEVVNF